MSFVQQQLLAPRPDSIASVNLPRRLDHFPSPADWRNETLYFLLVDRFSDGKEAQRPLLDRANLAAARPANWRWDLWSESGGDRWQGGTLHGVASKLDYLKELGVTCLWLSPVFKQRGHMNSFHGYGIQDFLDVDPHFGDRKALVDLVALAHVKGMRIILDIIFNHSGENWTYPADLPGGKYTPHYTSHRHGFGAWRNQQGDDTAVITSIDEGVWPSELQTPDAYTRAGAGSLGAGDIDDPYAEHKRADFITLKDFALDNPDVMNDLARCYKYWIALTDCDGFRIDTLKHVSYEQARNFCGSIKEFAANIGKHDFLLAGEIAGGDFGQDRYLDVLQRNLNAALDIGEMRVTLNQVAKGLQHPADYFAGFDPGNAVMGSHRALGAKHVSILDDHDHVFGKKLRFSAESATPQQVAAGVGLQLFTLGIPCIYYGTEQSLGGPEMHERVWLENFGSSDRYLRETLFGPEHPRKGGLAGLDAQNPLDENLPGFGPCGTQGHHCFDAQSPAYVRIRAMAKTRAAFPALRLGRQYLRPVSFLNNAFSVYSNGEIIAWSRILDDEECLVVLNPHGTAARGADILVDVALNPIASRMLLVMSTEESANPGLEKNRVGDHVSVHIHHSGIHFISVRDLGPSELLVFSNKP
ncbi:alpha-amylase [Cellvibrio sp. KY-GH-1]|uniref:alpha-amylase family glycosyl hydrolase n=1 Tax=Cellvibrio sp. KY-GH-1 TaxID=2303332 RepID=UPI0012493842|nr:alpha-amylase family glycosyl hydrolase [Cellvibrio sp. KY-GH-1]QEY17142.1 alpha-amylase [Cellvibrio sp. KY-GH-1]